MHKNVPKIRSASERRGHETEDSSAVTTPPKTWKQLSKKFQSLSPTLRKFLEDFPALLEKFSYDVTLSYLFYRIEQAQHTTLYCGLVKLLCTDAKLTRLTIEKWQIEQEDFETKFDVIFESKIPSDVSEKRVKAEEIRNGVLHGKKMLDSEKRRAISLVLEYADDLERKVKACASFSPFDDLRGFKGRGKALEGKRSRLILKGVGFRLS